MSKKPTDDAALQAEFDRTFVRGGQPLAIHPGWRPRLADLSRPRASFVRYGDEGTSRPPSGPAPVKPPAEKPKPVPAVRREPMPDAPRYPGQGQEPSRAELLVKMKSMTVDMNLPAELRDGAAGVLATLKALELGVEIVAAGEAVKPRSIASRMGIVADPAVASVTLGRAGEIVDFSGSHAQAKTALDRMQRAKETLAADEKRLVEQRARVRGRLAGHQETFTTTSGSKPAPSTVFSEKERKHVQDRMGRPAPRPPSTYANGVQELDMCSAEQARERLAQLKKENGR